MPSDYVEKLEMSEVDDKSQNFMKQVFNMTSNPSSTHDMLSDFLNEELNTNNHASNNSQSTNMSLDATNRMSQNLPSDLQFLRMDSFPSVPSIPSSVSHNQFQQVTSQEQNMTQQFTPQFSAVSGVQTSQFATSSYSQAENSQFHQQTVSHVHSDHKTFDSQSITSPSNHFMLSPGVTSPNNSNFEELKNSQFHQNSPQMINEVSSSVKSPDLSSQYTDDPSPEPMESRHGNMPVTHSSPSTEMINEPPAMKSCLLQNILTKDNNSEKLPSEQSNTVFSTGSKQFTPPSPPVQQVNLVPNNQFQSLPAGLLTSVQNTALPPGSILVLTPGQIQNSANPFSNQQFQTINSLNQNPFSVAIAAPQTQDMLIGTPSNVQGQINLGQLGQNQSVKFPTQSSNPQSPNMANSGLETSNSRSHDQQNTFRFTNASQNQTPDSELKFLLEKLAEPKQAAANRNLVEKLPQLRDILQSLCRQQSTNGPQNSDNVQMSNVCVDQPVMNNFVGNQSGSRQDAPMPSVSVSGHSPKPTEVKSMNLGNIGPSTMTLPHALQTTDENLKAILLKALEKHLEEQVQKQVKEEQMTTGGSVMETNQDLENAKQAKRFDQFAQENSFNKSPDLAACPQIAGQKRQLSPNRMNFTGFSVLGNSSQALPSHCFDAEANDGVTASPSKPNLTVLAGNYRNVEHFSEDTSMTQFMEKGNQMDTGYSAVSHPKLTISTSHDDSEDKANNGSMLRKILTAEVETGNSSPSPSPISSPEIQLESPSSLSSPNSGLFDGNTQLSLLQKSEELNLNSDNVDDTPSDLWNMFSDDDNISMVPTKSHKSKRNHDTHSTTFDKKLSVEALFDAGGAAKPNTFKFTQFGQGVVTFGQSQNEIEATPSLTNTITKNSAQTVAGGESLKSVAPPVTKPTSQNRKAKEASLSGPYPSKMGDLELRILTQPEEQHRARYLTEGSRGAVKDSTQQGYPVVQLLGYNEPTTLQIFIACESGRIKPHGFYQACRVCGKNSTQCTEKTYEGTVVIETEILPSNDMTVSIDCVGILKLRNADVEKRIGMVKAKAKKKNNTRARMVFRVTVKKPDGNFQVLQSASTPILCTQPIGQPEIGRVSLSGGSVSGGESLFIIGKNFMKGTKVLFQELTQDEATVVWEKEAEIDTEFFQQQHLICTIPEYHNKNIVKPAITQIVIRCNNKTSDPQKYLYNPVTESIKKEVPMETDEDQKAPSFVSPVALELNRLIQQTQNSQETTSRFQLPPGAVSGIAPSLTTLPTGSVSVAGHEGLQTIAGHNKLIMSSAKTHVNSPQVPIGTQANPQLIMVSNCMTLSQSNPVGVGTSSPNQSQPMIVILPANSNITNAQPSQINTNSQVESFLKSILGGKTTNS